MPRKHFFIFTFLLAVSFGSPALGAPFNQLGLNGPCVPDAQTLCLQNGKFALRVNFDDGNENSGPGTVLLNIDETGGFFYLDDDRHLDLFAQILDGCAVNGQYFVTLIGLSTHAQTVTIEEAGKVVKTYDNLLGDYFGVTDTAAIPCIETVQQEQDAVPGKVGDATVGTGPPALRADRFQITTIYEDFTMETFDGQPVEVTPQSGYFWFFNPENPDVVVKMVDGGAVNGNYWVFFGSQSSVAFEVQVVDTCSGSVNTYVNPAGTIPETVADTNAFPAASDCLLFADGFESGDTEAWSEAVGLPE